MTTKVDPEHHPCGPSRFWTVRNCAGSVALCRDLPDVPTDEMTRGTALHACLATRILDLPEPAIDPELDEDEIEALTWAHEKAKEVRKKLGHKPDKKVKVPFYTEHKMNLCHLHQVLTFGTADLLMVSPDGKRGSLIDWKFWRQEGEDDELASQLEILGAMALQSVPTMEVLNVMGCFPLLKTLAELEMTHDTVPIIIGAVRDAIKATEAPGAGLNTGQWCRRCRARGICPALEQITMEVSKRREERLPVDPRRRREQWDIRKLVVANCEAWFEAVKNDVRGGGPEPEGMQLISRRGGHCVKEVAAAIGELEGLFDLQTIYGEFVKLKLKNINQALKRRAEENGDPLLNYKDVLGPLVLEAEASCYLRATSAQKTEE